MDKNEKQIQTILRRELGEAPNGDLKFKWIFSENLLRPRAVLDPITARPVFDYRCTCGLNRMVHSPHCSGITVAQVRVELCKMVEKLKNQWVMCWWSPPDMTEEQWNQAFGACGAVYPSRGTYRPVSYLGPSGEGAPTVQYITLDPGIRPWPELTQYFCDVLKREQRKSEQQHAIDERELAERRQKERGDAVNEKIGELIGVPWESVPGKRGYGVSLPDPVLQGSGNAAPALIVP